MKKIVKLVTPFAAALALFLLASVSSASASTQELTQAEKENLYEQYVKIVDEVVAANDGLILSVVPMESFTDADWVSPEEYKQKALDRANMVIEIKAPDANGITPYGVTTATKYFEIHASQITRTVSAFGSFNIATSGGRQVFISMNSLTSSLSGGSGTWRQTGYSKAIIDGGRTYNITLSGVFTMDTLSSGHHIPLEFYCSATGVVS